jgi:hypothetical protein
MLMRLIFWGFCINPLGISPLHYVSSRSDFGFKFAEIFVMELSSQGVYKIAYRYNLFQTCKSMVIVHYILGFFFATLIF